MKAIRFDLPVKGEVEKYFLDKSIIPVERGEKIGEVVVATSACPRCGAWNSVICTYPIYDENDPHAAEVERLADMWGYDVLQAYLEKYDLYRKLEDSDICPCGED